MTFRPEWPALIAALALLQPARATAQDPDRDASPAIARLVDDPATPRVLVSPDRARLLVMDRRPPPSLTDPAARELTLAGIQLNPANHSPARASTFTSLVIQPLQGGVRRIVLPWQSQVLTAMWAPDGQSVAFTLVETTGTSLWLADASSGDIRLLLGPALNAALGNPCRWLPSGTGLLCTGIAIDSAAAPPGDEELVEHFFTDQMLLVPLSGAPRPIGLPGIHSSFAASPDGSYFLVETLRGPFFARVPWQRFGARFEVWDLNGQVVREVAERPLRERDPGSDDEVVAGPRSIGWRADAPASLFWLVALDGGIAASGVPVRDRLEVLEAPFTGSPAPFANLTHRGREVIWCRSDLALVTEDWPPFRKSRTWAIDPGRPAASARLLFERAWDGPSTDPGRFLTAPTPGGEALLLISKDGRYGFLTGVAASPQGDRPFFDRIELGTGKTLRLFRSEGPGLEEVVAILDREGGRILTRRRGGTWPTNYFVRKLGTSRPDRLTQLTQFRGPQP